MELVALGLLGVFGYLNTPVKKCVNLLPLPGPGPPPPPRQTTRDLEADFKADVGRHLQNEQVVLPYFRSEKSQNTNESLKDRRLQTFSGLDNMDHMSKTEIVAPPPVRGIANMHGSLFEPNIDVYKNALSGKDHSASPVVQQQVGPGLGIDPVTSSDGGFHQFFRIMPDNVNGYRKNTFAGDVVHGGSAVSNRPLDSFENTRESLSVNLTDDEMRTVGERSFHAKTPAAVSAPRQNAPYHLKSTNGENLNTCNSGSVFSNTAGTYTSQQFTRDTDRTMDARTPLGGGFVGTNPGGYQNAQYLHHATERETVNTHLTNVAGNQFGTYNVSAVDSATQRGQPTQDQTGAGNNYGAGSGVQGHTVQHMNEAKPTHRQSTHQAYIGTAFNNTGGHTQVPTDQLNRPTLRGSANNAENTTGRGAYISNATRTDAQVDMYQKVNVFDYEPNIQKTSNLMTHDMNLTRSGCDDNPNRISSNPQGFVSTRHIESIGNVCVHEKVPSENNRDFGFLPNNPLVTNILK
jgi:hypothetical protein